MLANQQPSSLRTATGEITSLVVTSSKSLSGGLILSSNLQQLTGLKMINLQRMQGNHFVVTTRNPRIMRYDTIHQDILGLYFYNTTLQGALVVAGGDLIHFKLVNKMPYTERKGFPEDAVPASRYDFESPLKIVLEVDILNRGTS